VLDLRTLSMVLRESQALNAPPAAKPTGIKIVQARTPLPTTRPATKTAMPPPTMTAASEVEYANSIAAIALFVRSADAIPFDRK